MRRIALVFLVAVTMATPASAKDWWNELLDDFAEVGLLQKVEKDRMNMAFTIAAPEPQVYAVIKKILAFHGYFLEGETGAGGRRHLRTSWKERSVNEFGVGFSRVRHRFDFETEEAGSLTILRVRPSLQGSERGGWTSFEDLQAREGVRRMVCQLLCGLRWPTTRATRVKVLTVYEERKNREESWKLPPAESSLPAYESGKI